MNATLRQSCVAAGTVLLLGGCVLGYVREDDPIFQRIAELEERVARIERVLQNDSLVQVANRLEQLHAETRELRGAVEQLQHDVEGAKKGQRDLYQDLDRRVRALETAVPAGGQPVSGASAASDQVAYQAAFELLKQGRYDQARQSFLQFLAAFPQSPLRDNAQYWLAEASYVTKAFKQAIAEFTAVIENYPDSAKIPDAWLKIGYCHYELGEWEQARKALTRVTQRFPDSAAAKLALERLKRMTDEGR